MSKIELQNFNDSTFKTKNQTNAKPRSSYFLSTSNIKPSTIQKECYLQKFVISIHNYYRSLWDIFTLFLSIYSCITMAYYAGFGLPKDSADFYVIIGVEVCFFIDIVLKFFTEYRDPENFEYVNDIRKIMKHYLTGWFIVDFIAMFPFSDITTQNVAYLKLLRLIRFPEIVDLLDQSKIAASILESYTRQNKTNYVSAARYIYKILKLLIFAILLTYFMGCFWYWLTIKITDDPGDNTFYNDNFPSTMSDSRKLIICCYFVLTTLSTVGYGDYQPQSNEEKIFAIMIMIVGIALFSHIMGNFGDVLANYEHEMGTVDKSSDLQTWIHIMHKLNQDKRLPQDLISAIDDHFAFSWNNDRLSTLTPDDPYLQQLPQQLKHQLIRHMFDDLFALFRGALLTSEFIDYYEGFYYELAFLLRPRKFEPGEIIIQQGEQFHEAYLIKEGNAILSIDIQDINITKTIGTGSSIGLRNIFSLEHSLSEYTYKANHKMQNPLKTFTISKAKLLNLLNDYEEIKLRMFRESLKIESSIQRNLKSQLRIHMGKINPTLSLSQIVDYFNDEISKYKTKSHSNNISNYHIAKGKVLDITQRLTTAEFGIEHLIGKMDDFNKDIGDQFEDVISHFSKIRVQVASKTRDNTTL